MGAGLVPVLESRISGVDSYAIEGKALARAWPAIDDLAQELGVKPFSELGDNSDDDDEAPASDMPWFAAAEGLKTVTALQEKLASAPDALPESEYVRSDLEEIRVILAAADKSHVRFRFEMMP